MVIFFSHNPKAFTTLSHQLVNWVIHYYSETKYLDEARCPARNHDD